jgi:WD40 repeat protein
MLSDSSLFPACYVTQIHPTRPLFVATGAWAGASIYTCPEVGSDTQGNLGNLIKHISDSNEKGRRSMTEKANGAFGQSITLDSGGNTIAVGTDKGIVSLYDVETGSTLAVIQNQSSIIRALEFAPTGELLVGSDQCSITLYDLRVPRPSERRGQGSHRLDTSYVDTLKGHDFWITDVKAAPDSRHIATSSADGQVRIWDLRGQPRRSVVFQTKEEQPVWSLSWKPEVYSSSSFVTGSGHAKSTLNSNSTRATGNVRWYQISGAA